MKRILISAALCASLLLPSTAATSEEAHSWDAEVSAINTVTGKSFEYSIMGYRIKLDFISPEKIRWTRLEAPDGTAGQSGEEDIVQTNLRPGVFLVAFTEAEGNVVDAFDLQRKRLFVTYITNNGKRFHNETSIEEVK
jgi:hypothetical protein